MDADWQHARHRDRYGPQDGARIRQQTLEAKEVSMDEQRRNRQRPGKYTTSYGSALAIGIVIGVIIGLVMGNVGIGIGIGIAIGIALAPVLDMSRKKKDEDKRP
jgi:F0F1-type ATP synthase assembly protein I